MVASLGCFSNMVCMGGVYIGWGRTDLWRNRSKVRDIDHQVKRTKRNLKNWNRIKKCFKYSPSSDASSKSVACQVVSIVHSMNTGHCCNPAIVCNQTRQQSAGLPRLCHKAPYKICAWPWQIRSTFSSLIVGKWNFVQCYSFLSIWHIGAASRRDDELLPWRHSPGS